MNIQELMQQAQKMQKKMASMDAEFKNETFKTESGGGAVTVTMNGDMKLVNIEYSKELLEGDDMDMLTDLLIAAINRSVDVVKKEKELRFSKIVGSKMGGVPGFF